MSMNEMYLCTFRQGSSNKLSSAYDSESTSVLSNKDSLSGFNTSK